MDVLSVISQRRSIRKYCNKPVENEKLCKVLEAARMAPSANNQQSLKFIVVEDYMKRVLLTEAAYGQEFLKEAPIVLVACGLDSNVMTCGHRCDTVNVSIAMSFVILEAFEQGLGTCWIAYYDEDKVKEILGIPSQVSVVMITPLGYSDENPAAKPRKQLEEIICYDRYY